MHTKIYTIDFGLTYYIITPRLSPVQKLILLFMNDKQVPLCTLYDMAEVSSVILFKNQTMDGTSVLYVLPEMYSIHLKNNPNYLNYPEAIYSVDILTVYKGKNLQENIPAIFP